MEATDPNSGNGIPPVEVLRRSSTRDRWSRTLDHRDYVIYLFVYFPSRISHRLTFFFYMQISLLANLVTPPRLYTRMRPFFNTASLVRHQRNPRSRSPWSFLRFIGSYGGFAHDSVSTPLQKHYAISIMCVLFPSCSDNF